MVFFFLFGELLFFVLFCQLIVVFLAVELSLGRFAQIHTPIVDSFELNYSALPSSLVLL